MNNRPSWDEYFINMLPAIGARSTCDRGRCGAIIVRDNTILSTGYAGAPKGFPHCDDVGHKYESVMKDESYYNYGEQIQHYKSVQEMHCIRTIHAEQNAIYHAAEIGALLKGATIYSTMFPCFRCAMAIVQVGIARVVAENDYQGSEESREIFSYANIMYTTINGETLYK